MQSDHSRRAERPTPRAMRQPGRPASAPASTDSVLNRVNAPGWSADHTISFHRPGHMPGRYRLDAFETMVCRVAADLASRGLRRSDRIGILSRNRLEWALVDLAALRLGIVTAGFEPEKFGDATDLAAAYRLSAVVADDDYPAVQGFGGMAIRMDDIGATADRRAGDAIPPIAPVRYEPDDVTTIKFTSGSTGAVKGLGARVGSIDQALRGVQSMFKHGPGDKLLVFLPLSLLQQRYWIYSAIAFGHDVTVTTPALAFEAIRAERPTVIMGVPAFFETLKARIEAWAEDTPERQGESALRAAARTVLGPNVRYLWTGSAPARPDVLAFFDEACGIPLFEGYGMNETCIVTKNHPGSHRRGTAGKPLDGITVTLDMDGVIRVKSQNPVNTAYMFGPAGASEAVFCADGSVRTGDLGRFDDDGYLYILGRSDDVVVLENGRNVIVRAIEERFAGHPSIAQVIVLGSGRPHLVALVHPAPGCHPQQARSTALELGSEVAVRAVVIIDEPFSMENGLLTSQGKFRRAAIAQLYGHEIEQAYGGSA